MILSDKNMKSLNVTKNSELIKVEQWLNANKLSLNYSKTKYLLIKPFAKNSHTNEFSASTQGIQVGNCHLAKYLGVIIDRARPIYRSADIYRLISWSSRYIVSVFTTNKISA